MNLYNILKQFILANFLITHSLHSFTHSLMHSVKHSRKLTCMHHTHTHTHTRTRTHTRTHTHYTHTFSSLHLYTHYYKPVNTLIAPWTKHGLPLATAWTNWLNKSGHSSGQSHRAIADMAYACNTSLTLS